MDKSKLKAFTKFNKAFMIEFACKKFGKWKGY